jgi:hypothetical protein
MLPSSKAPWFQDRVAWVNFLFAPEARINLLGKNLMSELGREI